MNQLYIDLKKCINENEYTSAKNNADTLKNYYTETIKNKLIKHKIGGYISGIIPLLDIVIQSGIKKNARTTIANEFKDELIDLNVISQTNKEMSKEEQNSFDDIKNKTNDNQSDILKTVARIGTISINFFSKTLLKSVMGIGVAVGILTGGLVMDYDIDSYIEFYVKRFDCRLLINLSFEDIDNYLIDNFESNEIICIYDIKKDKDDKDDYLSNPIKILNFYEEVKNEHPNYKVINNEKEIKKNCELYLNGNKIDFCNKYKFSKEGEYNIMIKFTQSLININYMFTDCK